MLSELFLGLPVIYTRDNISPTLVHLVSINLVKFFAFMASFDDVCSFRQSSKAALALVLCLNAATIISELFIVVFTP